MQNNRSFEGRDKYYHYSNTGNLSPIGQAVILVIMFVESFKADKGNNKITEHRTIF
jgi:hypothetical protein